MSQEDKSAQALAGALAEAEAAGADQSQIDALSGTGVTFAQYQEAIDRALDCMTSAGLEVVSTDVVRSNGQDVVSYAVASGTVADDQSPAVQEECYTTYAKFVDMFWQTSTPDGLAYQERRAGALRAPLEGCLADNGVDVPAGASFHDLVVLASQHTQEDQDCLGDVGYSTWEG
ncbi:hypothetical protein AGMMS50218_04060 [Actinomycetota bacterium]|nr:hypothetical protein AGMMS50218_04060 [Actinomycetota bacterium]